MAHWLPSQCVTMLLLSMITMCWRVGAIYEWGSETCSSLESEASEIRGTGCVGKGTIPTVYPSCKPCVFNYQCESGWCMSKSKKCYKSGTSCYTKPSAGCRNCPSSKTADLSKCNCKSTDFPNNWVKCTNGSDWKDQYNLAPGDNYKRKVNHDGSLLEDDEFAIYSQCYHNKFRQDAAKMNPVKWNNGLAAFAYEWTKVLKKTNNCKMKHSSGGLRKNIGGFRYSGENLYRFSTTGKINQNDIPKYGKKAVDGWYSEMKFYQYGGPDNTFGYCEYRNNKKGNAQVGHLTQLLWDSTTDIGCDYAMCNGDWNSIVVSCVYGPGGNIKGRPAFNISSYCALDEYPENKKKYGGLPTCVPGISCPVHGRNWGALFGSQGLRCKTDSGHYCKFPYVSGGDLVINNCQEAVLDYGYPRCELEGEPGWYSQCAEEQSDPNCKWANF